MKKRFYLLSCAIILISVSYFETLAAKENNYGTLRNDTIAPVDTTEDSYSSVTRDGASYGFLFSWDKKRSLDPHWTGLGFAFSSLNGLPDNVNLKRGMSYTISLNLADYSIPFSNHFLFVSGFGLDFTRYHFDGNIGLEKVGGVAQFVPSPEGINYKSSKLVAYYVTIPALIEYQTNVRRRNEFYVSGGLVCYLKYYSKSQVDYVENGNTLKISKGHDMNLLPVNAGFLLQIGFARGFTLFSTYSPISIFEDKKGPDVKPLSLGLRLNF